MSDPIMRYEFIIRVQVSDTRSRVNEVRAFLCDEIEDWEIDYGHIVEGIIVEVEPVKVLKNDRG